MGLPKGKLELTEGVISAVVSRAHYMDAAVMGDAAGLELGVERCVVHIGADPSYRPDLTLTVAMDRDTMASLFYMLADKLKLPAFNEKEWLEIRDSIDRDLIAHKPRDHETLVKASNAIFDAYMGPGPDLTNAFANSNEFPTPEPLVPQRLSEDQANDIQRHLDEHGEDAVVMAIRLEAEELTRLYKEERANGLSQQAACRAAKKRIEEL